MSQATPPHCGTPWPPTRAAASDDVSDREGAIRDGSSRAVLAAVYALVTWAAAAQVAMFQVPPAATAWDPVHRALGLPGIAVAVTAPLLAYGLWLGRRWGFVSWAMHATCLFGSSVVGALAWPHAATVLHLSIVAVLLLVVTLALRRPLALALRPGFLAPLPPAPRFSLRAPAELALGLEPLAGESVNISATGVLVACEGHALNVGSERLMTLRLSQGTFECLGRVARVNGEKVGLAFVGLNLAQKEYLEKLIQSDTGEEKP